MSLPSEPEFLEFVRILKRRKRLLAACCAAGFLIAGLHVRLSPKRYLAEVVLKYTPQTTPSKPADTIATETVSFEMDELIRRVSEKTRIPSSQIRSAASVRQIRGSNLISVRAIWPEPRTTVLLANAMADEAIRWRVERETLQMRESLAALRARREETDADIRDLEEEKRAFLEKHPSTGRGNRLSAQLLELESTRKELLSRFTENHPDVLRLETRIANLRDELTRLPAQEMASQRLERRLLAAAEESHRIRREESESRIELDTRRLHPDVTVYSRPEIPSRPAEPDLHRALTLWGSAGLVLGMILVFFLENTDPALSRIQQMETFIDLPVLGISPHFKDDRPCCLFTEIYHRRRDKALQPPSHPCRQRCSPCFVEHYHAARAGIEARLNRAGPKALVFTSSQMGEGKTMTSIGFGLAAAQSGLRTLLIDADMRRPSIHKAFSLPPDAGFADVLSRTKPWNSAVLSLQDMLLGQLDIDKLSAFPGIENLHLMTCLANRAHIVELLSSPALPDLITQLKGSYDYVLFDSTPVMMFCDAILLSSHVDGVVLVYRSGRTPRSTLQRAKQSLLEARRNLLGIVLNDQTLEDSEEEYGAYRRGYETYRESAAQSR